MKEKIKKIAKKLLLIILLLVGGGALAGIVQEEVGYGFLHGRKKLIREKNLIRICEKCYNKGRNNK